MHINRVRQALAVAATLLLATAAPADEWHFNDVDRVVAFSDVHGDYQAMVATLQSAQLIDQELAWTGGDTHFVLIGDILDRGPDSRQAMDLLMRLEGEAAAAGGQVHVLLGNHEIMNLIGDVRYIHPGEYASFAADETDAERNDWFAAFLELRAPADADPGELRQQFDEQYPAGFFAHRRAFAPAGRYGGWLLQKPIAVVVNDTAFVHGGLPPSVAETGLAGVNSALRGDVQLYAEQLQQLIDQRVLLPTDANHEHLAHVTNALSTGSPAPAVAAAIADVQRLDEELFSYQSPHWYRGHIYCSPITESDRLDGALAKLGASRVAIGHTPTPNRKVVVRLNGRVIEVDTGMNSRYYKGSGHALQIEGDSLSVISQDGEVTTPVPSARAVGARPGGRLSAATLEDVLLHGDIVTSPDDKALLQVSKDGRVLTARFVKGKRGVYPDVAAYRLDRLLRLDMVPVTVLREYDGKTGALQFVPIRQIDEVERQASQTGGAAWCPLPVQWNAMTIFDSLAGNSSRQLDTIHYDQRNWTVVLDGFDKAFTRSTKGPEQLSKAGVDVGRAWREALQTLDAASLASNLGDVLDDKRIAALIKRRDILLSQ